MMIDNIRKRGLVLGVLLASQSVWAAEFRIDDLPEIPRDEWPDILKNVEDHMITPFNGNSV